MLAHQILAFAAPTAARHFRRWLFHLGAIAFIPLGLLDSSVIPLPGSMDVLTIVLSERTPESWLYYAVMATVGSVLGGFLTYRLARKGGKETLESKVRPKTLKKVYGIFERWGFSAIAVAALLPPPAPFVPFLLAAGAMQYSVKKFLIALTLGRIARYCILGYLGAHYGRQVLKLVSIHGNATVIAAIALTAVALAALTYFLLRKHNLLIKRKKPATT